jgi:hypothetical protein
MKARRAKGIGFGYGVKEFFTRLHLLFLATEVNLLILDPEFCTKIKEL